MSEKRVKLAGIRKFIGDKLLESVNTIPQVSGTIPIDMTEFLALLEALRKNGHKVSGTSLLVKALAIALTESPQLNARQENDEIVYYDHINPGIAVSADSGLLVVTMKNVQEQSLMEIEAQFRELIGKVTAKKLTMDDTTGGTVTISNLMKEKLTSFNSIINNNECLIVGVGGLQKQAVVLVDGTIAARDMCTLIVNMNHTIVDGIAATKFLTRMQELLQNPAVRLLSERERDELL